MRAHGLFELLLILSRFAPGHFQKFPKICLDWYWGSPTIIWGPGSGISQDLPVTASCYPLTFCSTYHSPTYSYWIPTGFQQNF